MKRILNEGRRSLNVGVKRSFSTVNPSGNNMMALAYTPAGKRNEEKKEWKEGGVVRRDKGRSMH